MLSMTLLHIIVSTICSSAVARPHSLSEQAPVLASLEGTASTIMASADQQIRVPGNNNATFCTVSKEKQLFDIEFLEVAPSPLPVNKIFFAYLRGTAPDEPGLDNAELRITGEAAYESGDHQDPITYTIPLKTASFGDNAHLAVRNATGVYGGSLTQGRNDVLADFMILGMFVRTGWWTFRIEGVLPDGRYLFCFQTKQWLEHKNL